MPQTASREYIAQTRWLFHCHFKIKIPISETESLLEECFELVENIDKKYNSYQADSYFDKLNKQAGSWVSVDDTCIKMLKTVQLISSLCNGSYDISCMPLIRLWGFYRPHNDAPPSALEIEKTLEQVNYNNISIAGNNIKINFNQEIITASFIKSFAVDRVISLLKEKGITDAIVNAGGSSIMCINEKHHPHWTVNIPDPIHMEACSKKIVICNQCFSLSGKRNNHIIIANKKYGHILDSRTGMPASTLQVGIISNSAFEGDILSTALFTVKEEELKNTVKQLKKHFEFSYFRVAEDGIKTIG